jgi:hypothetical protein
MASVLGCFRQLFLDLPVNVARLSSHLEKFQMSLRTLHDESRQCCGLGTIYSGSGSDLGKVPDPDPNPDPGRIKAKYFK